MKTDAPLEEQAAMRKTVIFRCGLFGALALALLFVACRKRIDLKKEEAAYDAYIAALPDLKVAERSQARVLRVHYVEAKNLPTLDAREREALYRMLEQKTAALYGYTMRVEEFAQSAIEKFFKKNRKRFENFPIAYPAHAFPISFFAADRDARIRDALAPLFKKNDAARIATYLGPVRNADEAAAQFVKKLGAIFAEPDRQGRAIVDNENQDNENYYSYGHWSSLLQGEQNADFILTNVGVIGADTAMPLYVTARGGVTSAFVENNRYRPLQGAGVMGLYPFLADTAYFNEQRGKLSRAEQIECVLWLWLHELGHLLLKKEENYTYLDSVHRAPPDLKYYAWVERVRGTANHHTADIPTMKKF